MLKTQGLVVRYKDQLKLSQAAAHPRRGTNNTRMDFPARNERHATQHEAKKQRRKLQSSQLVLRFLLQEIMHQRNCRLPIADCQLTLGVA